MSQLHPSCLQLVLALALFLTLPLRAYGWGDYGHETIGRIAEKLLESDLKTKNSLRDIVGVEPMALSAKWPDHVRYDKRFEIFGDYHFMDEPTSPDGHHDFDAMVVLKQFPKIVPSTTASREEKMVALRYLIHVVGDMHQPLHAGTQQDFGGNSCKVFWKVGTPLPPSCQNLPPQKMELLNLPVKIATRPAVPFTPPSPTQMSNVHEIWDEFIVDYLREWIRRDQYCRAEVSQPGTMKGPAKQFTYAEFADELIKRHSSELNLAAASLDVDTWVSETTNLRKKAGYPDILPFEKRPYCGKKPDPNKDVPSLEVTFLENPVPDVGDNRREIAEKRIVLAGVRLAAYLKKLMAEVPVVSTATDTEILEKVHIQNPPNP